MSLSIFGQWVQDEPSPPTAYRREYRFNADGSYAFASTVEAAGSGTRQVVERERGIFEASIDRLVLSPASGSRLDVEWRVQVDTHRNQTQLVITRPDGVRETYSPA